MKRIIALICVLATLAFAMAGCGVLKDEVPTENTEAVYQN